MERMRRCINIMCQVVLRCFINAKCPTSHSRRCNAALTLIRRLVAAGTDAKKNMRHLQIMLLTATDDFSKPPERSSTRIYTVFYKQTLKGLETKTSRKHAYIILTPLNPSFI